ncbi:HNH endonuclease [Clostridium akagii]|uniref:HNH endonuclease n=1 Tax=Clostridium akagii TaxID=91623 RepID=UPI00047E7595|nr:HNH endonuclease [Clostridium akagii]
MEEDFNSEELELIKTEPYLKHQLSIIYPDKIISNLYKLNASLYVNSFRKICIIRAMSSVEYAKFLGYEWITKYDSKYDSKYDIDTIRILFQEFNLKQTDIANILNVKRQYVSKLINDSTNNHSNWVTDIISAEEEKIIIAMIDDRVTKYKKDEIIICILNNNKYENAILIKNMDQMKFVQNIPKAILAKFKQIGFDKYNEIDFENIKKIEEKGYNKGDIVIVLPDNIEVPTKTGKEPYIEFLGYNYYHPNTKTDEEIFNILLKYKINDNQICFTTQSEDYHMVYIALYRRNITVDEFAKQYNYEVVSDLSRSVNAVKGYVEDLTKRKIGIGNQVYVHSYDPLYAKLQQFTGKRDNSVDKFINKLGFERVLVVPEGYYQYDWKSEVDSEITEDKKIMILHMLKPFMIRGNLLYLPADSDEYVKLYDFIGKKGLKIDDVLQSWGIQRITLSSLKDFKKIKYQLSRIEKIQGNATVVLTKTEKVQRNNRLVKELKILYNYKCQICGEERIDLLIDMGDGKYYVEGHHIKLLSSAKQLTEQEEINEIDNYKNVIIVCSYHHKYLHYHHGGFFHIFRDKASKLYFENERGETIEVKLDLHLVAEQL